MIEKKWLEQGFIDEPIPEGTDVKGEIRRMCKEKKAYGSFCRLFFCIRCSIAQIAG